MRNSQVTKFLILFVFVFLCSCDLFKSMCEAEKPPKQSTTLQQIVNDTNAGETIDLEKYSNEYDITDYNAEISKNLTIKNGSFQNTTLKIKAEVKLEKVQELSVETSANLTIRDSKLNNLLLGTNAESRSTNSGNTNFDLKVIVKNCEIAEKIKINSKAKLNIAGEKTKIAKIVVAVAAEVCKILCTAEVDTKKIENVITDENGEKPEEIKITQAYKITYHSNCDELENIEDFFSPDDGTISLPTDIFKRNGYIFAGWYYDNNQAVEDSINVSDKTADINVYAKWIENIYIYDFTIEVTNLPESVKALSLWGTPNNWEFENIQKQADIYISKVTNGTAIFKFDKINTAEPLWCQFVPMTSRDMELNQSTWWQTAFSGSSEYATAENNLVYDFTTKKAVDKMTLVLDITSIYGDVSNVFNCRFITYNYKNAFTVISPTNEESFEDLGGTGVYSYKLNLNDISNAWNGSPNNPNFSIVLLTDAQVKASVNKFNFSSYAYQFYSYGDMGVGNPIMPGNYAVYGKNCYENSEYKYYSGVAATVTDTTLEVFVDMSQIMKAELKFFNSDTESEANLVTENMPVDLTDYKPYVFALIDGEKDPDNYVMTNETWDADLMEMTAGATFPTNLQQSAPTTGNTNEVKELTATADTVAATIRNLSAGTYTLKVSGGITNTTITEIANAMKANAMNSNTEAKINLDLSGANGVTTIGDNAFSHCSSLTSIEIPNSVTTIGTYAFFNCSSLTSVKIPDNVIEIKESAFIHCTALNSVTIGNGVTSIGASAFFNCFRLTSIEIPDSVTTIDQQAFEACSNLASVTIGNKVTSIGDYAFSDCSSLTNVTIPGNVDTIGGYVFYCCSNLTSVTINNGVTTIGSNAFYYCENLTSVTIPNSVTTIGNYAFYNCSNLTSVTINNGVTTIGSNAFEGCLSLTSVTIPSKVDNIGYRAFAKCSNLTKFEIDSGNQNYLSLDGGKILCRKVEDGNIFLIDYPSANGDVTIPENGNITTIGHSAFYACSALTSVKIPEGVTNINDCAFEECGNLESVTIPASTTDIANFRAFAKCSNLTKFEIDSGNQNYLSLDDGKILCRKIEDGTIFLIDYPSANGDVTIPENITTIDHSAFWGCSMTNVTIPNSVTKIDCDAFLACANLVSITIPSRVVYIGTQAFSECSKLTSITFNDTGSTWYCTDSEEYTGGEIIDVTDTAQNANTLKVPYYDKYWYKSSTGGTAN